MANKKHRLELTWKIEQGSRGTDDDPINPLSRAVNRLFRPKPNKCAMKGNKHGWTLGDERE
jgi:hypothetical protein